MKPVLFILSGILLLCSCGSDEASDPIEQMPNYFPDAVGSQWVYLNSEGTQRTLEVSYEIEIDGKNYRTFKETPPDEETDFDLLNPIAYRVTENQILFAVSGKVDTYVQNEIPVMVQDELAGLDLRAIAEPIPPPELVFLQFPPSLSFQWSALDVRVSGNIILQNLPLLQFPFEVLMRVTGEVVSEGPLETPAGNFAKTYQIEYQTEITQTLFSQTKVMRQDQTIWFAPHVGIAKTESEGGVTELLEYSVE